MLNVISKRSRLIICVGIFVAAVALIWAGANKEFFETDYSAWRHDWVILKEQLRAGSTGPISGLSKFPVAYLINSFVGGENSRNLLLLNFFALFIPIVLLSLLRGMKVAVLAGCVYLASLVLSPIPAFYLFSGALEIQSGMVSGVFIAAISMLSFENFNSQRQEKVLLFVLSVAGLLLPLYKDTGVLVLTVSFLFLVVVRKFKLSNVLDDALSRKKSHLLLLFGMVPTMLGIFLSGYYNFLKYQDVLPLEYLSESAQTSPELLKSLEFFLGSIFSPNGGLAIFWALPFFVALVFWRLVGFSPRNSVVWLGSLTVILTCLGLARWWAPFGWDSWGNRLIIPPVFALFVAMFVSLEPCSERFILISRPPRWWFFSSPVIFLSAYYFMVPYLSSNFASARSASLSPGEACRNMYGALQSNHHGSSLQFWRSEVYYHCARERMMHLPVPAQLHNFRVNK